MRTSSPVWPESGSRSKQARERSRHDGGGRLVVVEGDDDGLREEAGEVVLEGVNEQVADDEGFAGALRCGTTPPADGTFQLGRAVDSRAHGDTLRGVPEWQTAGSGGRDDTVRRLGGNRASR